MKQSRTTAHPHHASDRHGPPVSIGISLAAIACLILLATLVAGGPLRAQPRASAASAGPLLQTDVASGPPGTVVQLNGQGFVRTADAVTNVFTFESTPSPQISLSLPQPAITVCGNNVPSFGFGVPCTTTPYSFQIPVGTPPGSYQFHFVTPSANGGTPYMDVSAPFQVTAPVTLTPTASATATVTSTAAATDTATATPSASPSATITNTAVPNAPTATNTPVPPLVTSTPVPATATLVPVTATATATATATPKPRPFLALVRPEFNHDRLAIALRAGAGAAVHVDFTITAGGHTLFHAAKDGTTNKLGTFSLNLAIAYPARKPGQALLTIKESDAAGIKTVMRTFHYRYF